MTIIGLDLSLTATGVATPDVLEIIATHPTGQPTDVIDRCATIAARIHPHIEHADLIIIEDLPPARANALKKLGKLHGVIEWHLAHVWGSNYRYLPPSTIKKLATGRGNAPKLEVIIAARERLGLDVTDDNLADAAWLRVAGQHLAGDPDAPSLPKSHLAALAKFR